MIYILSSSLTTLVFSSIVYSTPSTHSNSILAPYLHF